MLYTKAMWKAAFMSRVCKLQRPYEFWETGAERAALKKKMVVMRCSSQLQMWRSYCLNNGRATRMYQERVVH